MTRTRNRLAELAASASIDLRLGFRMLIKYPMLTIVGGLAITVAAALGIGVSEFVRDILFPKVPLEQGDRVVRLTNDGAATTLYDFVLWRDDLESVVDVGASRLTELGAVTADGRTGAVSVAQITASAFPMARVDAQIGRVLTEDDEREGAPPIVVLGYETWQALFEGNVQAIGQVLQLGGAETTVVGVMPEGFGFPSNAGGWVPLRFRPSEAVPGAGRSVTVFGRLADGASLEEARAELSAVGARTAADHPDTHGESKAELIPFASPFGSDDSFLVTAVFNGLRLFLVLLLAIPCVNVATLVFARTVTREGEIAVRMSLGATRRRIVLQLFAEAIVLVSAATLMSLVIVRWGLSAVAENFFIIQQAGGLPFGWNERLSVPTILYAGLLSLAAALVIGVVPALKATRGAVQPRLSELSTGTISRLRFGGVWTAIIVIQVAFSVAFLPLAVTQANVVFGLFQANQALETDFPAAEYVTAQLGRDAVIPPQGAAERAEFLEVSRQLFEEVKNRLAADPRVESVAFASGLFAMNHLTTPVEHVGDGASGTTAGRARTLLVEPAYLEMMGATVVTGRGFQAADFAPGARAVVVNQAFVDLVLSGRNAVGGQLRYPSRCGSDDEQGCESSAVQVPAVGESFEVVGVVANPGMDAYATGNAPAVYAPITLAPVDARALGLVGMPAAPATQLFVRLRPGSDPITTTLYDVIASVDPSLRLSQLGTLEDTWRPVHQGARLGVWILMIVAGVVLLLSALGIYALMSFTVSQRTREIAIRQAVGASPRRILASVFRRSLLQLGLGVLVGLLVAFPVILNSGTAAPRTVLIVATLLLAVGLASCLVPILRALRIPPAAAVKTG